MPTPDDGDFEDQLSRAMRSSVATVQPPVHDLVAGGLARGHAGRRRRRVVLAGAAATVVAVAGVGAAIATYGDASSSTSTASGGACSAVSTGVLPAWARGGFSDAKPSVPHVLGERGNIVAILFGGQLYSPPSDTVGNKILWVGRSDDSDALTPLRIDAVRAGTTRHVRREVSGGPGPSGIDLPGAGCWRMSLQWGPGPDQRDTIKLSYVRP
jgi:hypothetical protein